jgi:histidinol-phosphatase (PHP family)
VTELPADSHVHSEWSWDARFGSMDLTCARAVEIGLPVVAFTEHVDFTRFRAGYLVENFCHLVSDGILQAPPLDVEGYLRSVENCRRKYPALRVLSGLEVGQPHRHQSELAALLSQGPFDRVLGSLHCLPDGEEFAEPFELFPNHPVDAVFRENLAEIPRMVAGSTLFDVFSHIDYPVRSWPAGAQPFNPGDYEEELRYALKSIAMSGRVLEVNAKLPLDEVILRWWVHEGGDRITFGSDAHEPWTLGEGLELVAAMAEAHGFRPDTKPEDPWIVVRKT